MRTLTNEFFKDVNKTGDDSKWWRYLKKVFDESVMALQNMKFDADRKILNLCQGLKNRCIC